MNSAKASLLDNESAGQAGQLRTQSGWNDLMLTSRVRLLQIIPSSLILYSLTSQTSLEPWYLQRGSKGKGVD